MTMAPVKPNLDEQQYLAAMEHDAFILGTLLDLLAKSKCLLGVHKGEDGVPMYVVFTQAARRLSVTLTLDAVLKTLEDEIHNNMERA